MKKSLVVFALLCVSSALSAPALGANGTTSEGVQMQAGPGREYPAVMRLAALLKVTIHGCARASDWCDVEWRGNRGWVPASTLGDELNRTLLSGTAYGPRVGIPDVEFDLAKYWEAHYQQRPWYPQKEDWNSPPQARVRTSVDVVD